MKEEDVNTTTTSTKKPFLFATGHYARLWHHDFYDDDDDHEHENHMNNDIIRSATNISHYSYYVLEIVVK